tara:strand:- start:199 stop:954 length:756 start_codon:yes stop_codon:yes gene_type:complete
MIANKNPSACALIIGNEILSGRTKDVNLNFIAGRLTELGIRLLEARVIPDASDVIIDTVNECRARYDYVFTTGGIGPTHDDITAECIAKAFGVELAQHPEARKLIAGMCEKNGVELNEARLRMANVPEGGVLVNNPVSGAPGFKMENVFVLAGVPRIMQDMFAGCESHLEGGRKVKSRTVIAYLAEGIIAEPLRELQAGYEHVEIGSYPFYTDGKFGTNLVLRSDSDASLLEALKEVAELVRRLGADPEVE